MRWALLACLLAGCYRASNLACAVTCASDLSCPDGLQCGLSDHLCHVGPRECSESDAGVPDDVGPLPLIDAPNPDAPSVPFCDPNQAKMVACYQFENTTDDGSKNKLPTNPSGIMFQTSMNGLGKALQLLDTSFVQIAEKLKLDLQQFTMEAWLNPPSISGQNLFVVNNPGQYGMFLDTTGAPYCVVAPPQASFFTAVGSALMLNHWTHVACVYNGNKLTLYVNGSVAMENPKASAVGTANMSGTWIGSSAADTPMQNHYVGLIDNLRIWSVARTQAEICAGAGLTCP